MRGGREATERRRARAKEAEAERSARIEAMGGLDAYWFWRLATQHPGAKERRKLMRRTQGRNDG
jgi:hypothetical protein